MYPLKTIYSEIPILFMLLGFGFMVYVLVFVHLDSTGRSILSDPVVTALFCSRQGRIVNQYMHMHATPASPVCCVQSSTPMNLPTTHSCNSFRPVSVPAVAVQTIRPRLMVRSYDPIFCQQSFHVFKCGHLIHQIV
jgi:hypothetical protein